MMRSALYVLAVFQFVVSVAGAHPVAQGSMDIIVSYDHIDIRARVSTEEVLIAEALGGKTNDKSGTMEDVWRHHGDYLTEHLHLAADSIQFTGRVAAFTPPAKRSVTSCITYDLKFEIPMEARGLHTFVARQDVLNEFLFAPGNSWEASYIVRISRAQHPAHEAFLFTSRQPLILTCAGTTSMGEGAPHFNEWVMFRTFIRYGIAHILGGYDHLLFIAGLVIALSTFWDLLKIVTAFTIAHTITLTLAVLDIIRLSSRIVEPMIAASIVVIALQNLTASGRNRSRARLIIAFGFGLFHGLGFAGGLLSAMEGMEGVMILTAIVAFSLGVEIGHQLVAVPLFAAMRVTRSEKWSQSDPERIPRWALHIGSTVICGAGMMYFIAALR